MGLAETRSLVDDAKHFVAVVWASLHYTLLTASRQEPGAAWSFQYWDSLPSESASAHMAASRLAANLGLLHPGQLVPHSHPGIQSDAWSCGLWSLANLEFSMRSMRGEATGPFVGIRMALVRLNEYISKLKPGAPAPPVGPRHARLPPPASLDEALVRAQDCSKCHATRVGTKGCRSCMGKFFDEIKVRVCVSAVFGFGFLHLLLLLLRKEIPCVT